MLKHKPNWDTGEKEEKERRQEDKLREGGEGRNKRLIRRKYQQSEFALLTGVAGKSMDFRPYNWAAPSCHHLFWDWATCWLPQFSSVAQSCPILCDPMNRSTPGLPVHHQLQEFTQTHIDVRYLRPSCPRSFSFCFSSPAFFWNIWIFLKEFHFN